MYPEYEGDQYYDRSWYQDGDDQRSDRYPDYTNCQLQQTIVFIRPYWIEEKGDFG
jgi:hypothetical protein